MNARGGGGVSFQDMYVLENGRQNHMIQLLKKFYALKEHHKLTALSEMNTSAERNSDV